MTAPYMRQITEECYRTLKAHDDLGELDDGHTYYRDEAGDPWEAWSAEWIVSTAGYLYDGDWRPGDEAEMADYFGIPLELCGRLTAIMERFDRTDDDEEDGE